MAGPPIDEDGLSELSIDPCWNSLDNNFKRETFLEVYTVLLAVETSTKIENGENFRKFTYRVIAEKASKGGGGL
jgi:hypothetical protein